MPYHQLSLYERERIAVMHANDQTPAAIGRALGRSRSTIGRELARNRATAGHSRNGLGFMKGYTGGEAQRLSRARRGAANSRRARLGDNALGDYVRDGLSRYWSPQQIAGRLDVDHPETSTMRISHEAIYQWVYRQARGGGSWYRCLRRARRKRRPRIPVRKASKQVFGGAVGIAQRPAVVAARARLGDWESDTVVGTRPGRVVLATHVERVSRYVLIRKLKDGRAATFNRASVRAFAEVPSAYRLTLTADNGAEFARFAGLGKRLGLSVYFAEPYKAWQRGANENANGLIRQFFPKGLDLSGVSHQQVAKVADLLNNRPRKCLNYRTPAEVFRPPPAVALRN